MFAVLTVGMASAFSNFLGNEDCPKQVLAEDVDATQEETEEDFEFDFADEEDDYYEPEDLCKVDHEALDKYMKKFRKLQLKDDVKYNDKKYFLYRDFAIELLQKRNSLFYKLSNCEYFNENYREELTKIAEKEMKFIEKRWITPYNSPKKAGNWKAAAETWEFAYYKDKGQIPFYQNCRNWQLLNVMFFNGKKRIKFIHLDGEKELVQINDFYQALSRESAYGKNLFSHKNDQFKFVCHSTITSDKVTKDEKLRKKYVNDFVISGKLASKYFYKSTYSKTYVEGLIASHDYEMLCNVRLTRFAEEYYNVEGSWDWKYINKHYKGKEIAFSPKNWIYIDSINE